MEQVLLMQKGRACSASGLRTEPFSGGTAAAGVLMASWSGSQKLADK